MIAFLSGLWGKVAFAAAFLGLLALAVLKVFGAGKAAAKAEATMEALKRTREANAARAQASRPITREEEARDPFNRDIR